MGGGKVRMWGRMGKNVHQRNEKEEKEEEGGTAS